MRRRKPQDKRPARIHPESLMMSFGYRPEWSEGAIKPPLFQTSTFVFPTAEAGKESFAYAYGLKQRDPARPMGLIYSRLNNPNLEILEDRLTLWDEAEAGAVFASGMAAISTTMLALVPLGHAVVFSRPVYGGTDFLLEHLLPEKGTATRAFPAGGDPQAVADVCAALERRGAPPRLVFIETPANPTLTLTDIAGVAEVAHQFGALCAVDNTLLGPLYQHPLRHGADLVLYSATKHLGGHSDVVAGVALGSAALVEQIKLYRTILGSMLDPHSAWLLLRSLETAKLRMTCASKNAERVALWLAEHPRVARVHYPGLLRARVGSRRAGSAAGEQRRIYERQCSGPGSLITFELADAGEAEAFGFLNAVELIRLAVSLGGTESLIEHPATMTHADVPTADQVAGGITPAMVRLSVGIEHPDDLISDLAQALDRIPIAAGDRPEAPASTNALTV